MTIVVPNSASLATPRNTDAALALAATLFYVCLHWFQGFPTLAGGGGDNDSLMRLVQVRDLIGGQGWFDLMQYRMGPEGGFPMHWSRLVDLPIAAIILSTTALTGSMAIGEAVALVVWPTALFGVALFLIVRMARMTGGEWAALPAAVIGGMALFYINIFAPGALDHHNVQLALVLVTGFFLMRACKTATAAAFAGLAAALMLAVAMEAAPYVAVACVVATVPFLIRGRPEARIAVHFGLAFAGMAALAFLATVPTRDWLAAQCDAYSLPQFSLAAIGGIGLAATVAVPALNGSLPRRVAALGAVAAIVALFALSYFPQCLADPYAAIDPKLKQYWLNAVSEAQSVASILRNDPSLFAGYYVTPALAIVVLGWRAVRGLLTRADAIVGAFLVAAILVSFWQVRGAVFSGPLAAIPLAAWVGSWRRKSDEDGGSIRSQLAMAAAWVVSINLVWRFAAMGIAAAAGGPAAVSTKADMKAEPCYAFADYEALAALPPGTVLAISNLGSSLLRETPHRTLAGSYHRNIAGNQATLDALMGSSADAARVARIHGVDYIAICKGNAETGAIVGWAPEGFLAKLVAGETPAWLTPVPSMTGAPLELFRVSP